MEETKNWETEVENLTQGMDFLKLTTGSHKIKFLDEGMDKVVTYENKDIEKIFFKVQHLNLDGSIIGEFTWTVTRGNTVNSLYGQIALIGKAHGSLKDQVITLAVKGEGKNRDYTVIEALDYIKAEADLRKKVTTEQVKA